VHAFYIVLAVILVALNPMLIFRGLHPALCAHWLILASLYHYLKTPTAFTVKTINNKQVGLLLLSALINPYLFMMVIGFNVILPFKNYFYDKLLSLKQALLYVATSIVLPLLLWFVVGLISLGSNANMEVVNGYGLYNLNLNSFYNPTGFSRMLPQLKQTSEMQYEGFSYLGTGMMVLLLVAVGFYLFTLLVRKRNVLRNKALLPIFLLAFMMTIFAVTNKVSFNDKLLFEFGLPEFLLKLGGIFRASGRFIWVAYYLIFFFSILVFVKSRISDKIKMPVFAALVLFQLYDTQPLLTARDLPSGPYKITKLSEDKWSSITSGFKRIITYPAFDNHLLYNMSYQDLCFIALKHHQPITCGYVARESGDANKKFADTLSRRLSMADISPDDLYITTAANLDAFKPLIYQKKVMVRSLDGFYYIYAVQSNNRVKIVPSPAEVKKGDSIYNAVRNDVKISTIATPVFVKEKLKYNVESYVFENNIIQIKGWAFRPDAEEDQKDSIYIVVTSPESSYISKAKLIKRPDLVGAFHKKGIENSGFAATIFTENIPGKTFGVALAVKNKDNQWTYEMLPQIEPLDLEKKMPPQRIASIPKSSENAISHIEKTEQQAKSIYIDGWAAIENQNAKSSVIKLLLINGKNVYLADTQKKKREDVTKFYNGQYNYDDAGFYVNLKKGWLPKGKYKLGIVVSDKAKTAVVISDEAIDVK
jgi:hypothetical protein